MEHTFSVVQQQTALHFLCEHSLCILEMAFNPLLPGSHQKLLSFEMELQWQINHKKSGKHQIAWGWRQEEE